MADLRYGTFALSDLDNAAALTTGSGSRTASGSISFSSPFPGDEAKQITVLISTAGFDIETGEDVGGIHNIRLKTSVLSADNTQFTAVVETWSKSVIWSAWFNYTAFVD